MNLRNELTKTEGYTLGKRKKKNISSISFNKISQRFYVFLTTATILERATAFRKLFMK